MYQNSQYWKEYKESLKDETEAGLIGFCEYLSRKLDEVPQSGIVYNVEWIDSFKIRLTKEVNDE